jgi:hypothetical protein
MRSIVKRNLAAKRLLQLAIASVCFAMFAATAEASQPPDDGYALPETSVLYPPGSRYYGAVDPNPIGYYPYSYYQGSGFPVGRAVGYYPYPDAHPYVPVPYGFGYGYPFGYGYFGNPYGFGYFGYPYGYSAVPFFGYPGWGTVSPYGFGF